MHKPLVTPETAPLHPVPVQCTHYAVGVAFDPRQHTEFAFRVIGIERTHEDGHVEFVGLHQTHSALLDAAASAAIEAEANRLLKAAGAP